MRRIFGAAKKEAPAPTLDETGEKLQGRGDKVDENIAKLDAQLVKFKEQIAKTRPGPTQDGLKRRALQVLKQKKLFEGQRDQLYSQQYNIEQTKFTVDSIQTTVSTVQALSAASKQMTKDFKKQKELDIDYIDKMQDDMMDMMDRVGEINDAMGRSYNVPDDVDESDLMAELDALELDMGTEVSTAGGVPSYLNEPEGLTDFPAAPTKTQEPAAIANDPQQPQQTAAAPLRF